MRIEVFVIILNSINSKDRSEIRRRGTTFVFKIIHKLNTHPTLYTTSRITVKHTQHHLYFIYGSIRISLNFY